ncbi:MAG TPA: FAD-binding oxidoreductase [Acidimicrobiales bacterium]|nr:FAD-binding oxidoreductase [Acidimicrobiales bacterium]
MKADRSEGHVRGERRLLTGWGRTAPSAAWLTTPDDPDEVGRLLATPPRAAGTTVPPPAPTARREWRGAIARGLGRSYGDAAQCAGGVVVDTARLGGIGPIDPESGLVEVGGGVSLHELLGRSLPMGWFVPVSPGTRLVTVGGAIAADIHGKNHHRDGSFARHVPSFTLVTPTGTHEVDQLGDPSLFWATAGGMGLTGVVTRAIIRLIPVETSSMLVDTERFDRLGDVMGAMEASDAAYRYSVAWVDCMGSRRHLGRSVLTRGDHAPRSALPPGRAGAALPVPRGPRLRVPVPAPGGLLNARSVGAFNGLWFRRSPRREAGALRPLSSFFHPLDGIADWNLLYGPRGFVQYQFVVGPEHGESVERAVAMIGRSGAPSFLAVLKRFGPGDPGPLSFPLEGWTLALDFPIGPPVLPSLLDRLDSLVAGVGGRVYLAKDSRLRPELLPVMYPRLGELQVVRRRVDPCRVLQSDLSRRLGIDGATTGE